MNEEITFRPMKKSDDKKQVARLIYLTDEYIFPYLFEGDISRAERVFPLEIESRSLYSRKHIFVAEKQGKIVGIIVALRSPFRMSQKKMKQAFIKAGVYCEERFEQTYRDYYGKLGKYYKGIYIANVAVAEEARGQGVAQAMLAAFLKKNKTYFLEAVTKNAPAVRVYEKAGFQTIDEIMGFENVPLYVMVRAKGKNN